MGSDTWDSGWLVAFVVELPWDGPPVGAPRSYAPGLGSQARPEGLKAKGFMSVPGEGQQEQREAEGQCESESRRI